VDSDFTVHITNRWGVRGREYHRRQKKHSMVEIKAENNEEVVSKCIVGSVKGER